MAGSIRSNIQGMYDETFRTVVLPAFERSSQEMFRQVDEAFRRGITECEHLSLSNLASSLLSLILFFFVSFFRFFFIFGRLLQLLKMWCRARARVFNLGSESFGYNFLYTAMPL